MKPLENLKQGFKHHTDQGRKKIWKDDRRLKSSRLNGRLLFSIAFWAVFAGAIFFTFQSWARTGFLNEKVNGYQDKASAQIARLNEAGFANSPAGEDYAAQFIAAYINVPYNEKEREERSNTLQSYLAEGLTAGQLEDLSAFGGKRVLKSASLYDVKNVSNTAASYVYRIEYELFKIVEKEQEAEKKEGSEEIAGEEKITAYEEALGKKEQMIVVRLGTDGNSFNVIEQPYYEALPAVTRLVSVQDSTDQANRNTKAESALKQFASQFFTSYTTNSIEEMSYLMEEPETLQGLYEYRGLEDFVVYDGEQKGQYIVKTLVLLQEGDADLQTKHPFTLIVTKENNKFYVQDFKHTIGG
ncbi:conjugal transfer protein [Bacillus sp. ISL-47]|uniref:conjugal transfer protein n=1 Tax=Bacillus sp. ISL-47 TaxID=2819130 RepID=UPI001BE7CB2D|nr:conjugal transfer protein [Bacillus sp. ISL-47]MBT2688353.1 conjugal transfer protein [Bacillus sp. ISL-47]MBT2710536.1 conjugal transfer protein [Pseudomonas sp. ISL-84]